jgi:hypothetical protein
MTIVLLARQRDSRWICSKVTHLRVMAYGGVEWQVIDEVISTHNSRWCRVRPTCRSSWLFDRPHLLALPSMTKPIKLIRPLVNDRLCQSLSNLLLPLRCRPHHHRLCPRLLPLHHLRLCSPNPLLLYNSDLLPLYRLDLRPRYLGNQLPNPRPKATTRRQRSMSSNQPMSFSSTLSMAGVNSRAASRP